MTKFLECSEKLDILKTLEGGLCKKLVCSDYDEALLELVLLFCKSSTIEDMVSKC
jgi:hypothetical protein